MNKKYILIMGAGIIIIAVGIYFWATRTSPEATTPTDNQTVTLPSAGSVPGTSPGTAGGSDTSVAAVDGGTIPTKNFMSDPATAKDPIAKGFYYLGYHVNEGVPDPTATDNPPYIISYISATQYFNIALMQEPIGSVRAEAEQYLMEHLGISQDQMCHLKYMVSVPSRVNSQFASRNLGFSFCPGATALPK